MAGPQENSVPVCPHCLAPLGQFDHFCPKCGGPVSAHATIDPMGQVHSLGWMYGKAGNAPRGIVVIGVWLVIGWQVPLLLFGVFVLLSSLLAPGRSYRIGPDSFLTPGSNGAASDIISLVAALGLTTIYVIVLAKITSRYARARRRKLELRKGDIQN